MNKPTKLVKKVVYWDCGRGHQHQTKKAAEKCIATRPAEVVRAERRKRRAEIGLAFLNSDKSLAELARHFECHRSTVQDCAYDIIESLAGEKNTVWIDFMKIWLTPNIGRSVALRECWRRYIERGIEAQILNDEQWQAFFGAPRNRRIRIKPALLDALR